ncbi:MAG: GSU2403 family nucleotidyltransferase fold protein [Desulfobaccales bacterium]
MAADYSFREFQESQQRTLDRAVRAHQAYREAVQASRPFKGGMHWKKIAGREYLYKYRDRYGHGRSLGARSPDTEGMWADFTAQRREAAARLGKQRQLLAEAARFCRAALIHRVPDPVTRILRYLTEGDLSGGPVMVIGTQALAAYEFAAGVFIEAPKASPFWSGAGSRLTLAAPAAIPPAELLARLRRADRSFQALPGPGFVAVNKTGFRVSFLTPPTVRPPHRIRVKDAPSPPVPAAAGDLAALVHSPKFSQVVIGRRGDPVTMVVPDPRALALHKLWLSQQEDREPAARSRDRSQASALVELILRYLPQYYFFSAELHLFPAEAIRQAEGLVEGYEVDGDLEGDY